MEETSYKKTESTKVGSKKNKFGSIPEEWSVMSLDDVFEFLPTTSFSRDDLQHEATGIAYIHYGDIHATYDSNLLNIPECTDIPFLKENINLPKTVAYLKTGDLVVADASEDYAGVGACIEIVCDSETKAISGLHTFALRPKDGLTAGGFRTYLLKHPRVGIELKKIVTGSKVYGLSKANFLKFEVVLPPLPEQRKIAEILSTWDRAIDVLGKLIEKKKERKKGLMQVLLSGKIRFKEFIASLGFTVTKYGEVPNDWNEVKLYQVVKKIRLGGNYENSEYNNGVPLMKMGNLDRGRFKFDKVEKVLKGEAYSPNDVLKRGDLLFNTRNTLDLVGKVARWNNELPMALFNSNLLRLDFDDRIEESNQFTNYYFNSITGLRQLRALAIGTTSVAAIYTRDLMKFKFFLPKIEEQHKIASVLFTADREIEKLKAQLEKLEEQKKGLMQKLLTGEIRVNER